MDFQHSARSLELQERVRQFEGFAELFQAFRDAGRRHYGELSQVDPEAP